MWPEKIAYKNILLTVAVSDIVTNRRQKRHAGSEGKVVVARLAATFQ